MAEGKFPSVQEHLKQWSQTIIDELRKSAVLQMNLNKGKRSTSVGDPQASPLVAGMRTSMTVLGRTVTAEIIMPSEWYWLEHGRPPGKMPPEEPIIKWIVHRGFPIKLDSGSKKKIKDVSKRLFISKPEIRKTRKLLKQVSMDKRRKQLAFLIRRRIADYGTRDTHFFSNVVTPKLINDLKVTMKEKFKKDIRIDFIEALQ